MCFEKVILARSPNPDQICGLYLRDGIVGFVDLPIIEMHDARTLEDYQKILNKHFKKFTPTRGVLNNLVPSLRGYEICDMCCFHPQDKKFSCCLFLSTSSILYFVYLNALKKVAIEKVDKNVKTIDAGRTFFLYAKQKKRVDCIIKLDVSFEREKPRRKQSILLEERNKVHKIKCYHDDYDLTLVNAESSSQKKHVLSLSYTQPVTEINWGFSVNPEHRHIKENEEFPTMNNKDLSPHQALYFGDGSRTKHLLGRVANEIRFYNTIFPYMDTKSIIDFKSACRKTNQLPQHTTTLKRISSAKPESWRIVDYSFDSMTIKYALKKYVIDHANYLSTDDFLFPYSDKEYLFLNFNHNTMKKLTIPESSKFLTVKTEEVDPYTTTTVPPVDFLYFVDKHGLIHKTTIFLNRPIEINRTTIEPESIKNFAITKDYLVILDKKSQIWTLSNNNKVQRSQRMILNTREFLRQCKTSFKRVHQLNEQGNKYYRKNTYVIQFTSITSFSENQLIVEATGTSYKTIFRDIFIINVSEEKPQIRSIVATSTKPEGYNNCNVATSGKNIFYYTMDKKTQLPVMVRRNFEAGINRKHYLPALPSRILTSKHCIIVIFDIEVIRKNLNIYKRFFKEIMPHNTLPSLGGHLIHIYNKYRRVKI